MENKNITKAIIATMKAIKGIEKTMTIGAGNNSYKGVPDQEVKKIIGEAMTNNGLCILPTKVTPKIQIDRWEQEYNGQKQTKQSAFTEVVTEYLLLHESGESITISGYGHGVDSQDKGAGKATTYALKYALLYMFMVPTGKIDDADVTHSDNIEEPVKNETAKNETTDTKGWLSDKNCDIICQRIIAGEKDLLEKTKTIYKISKANYAKMEVAHKN